MYVRIVIFYPNAILIKNCETSPIPQFYFEQYVSVTGFCRNSFYISCRFHKGKGRYGLFSVR